MKRVLATLLIASFWASAAGAADEKDIYAIRGAGLLPCERYVAEREQDSALYTRFLGWLDGYLTGVNELTAETYDIALFESTDLLAVLIEQHCRENPSEQFAGVARAIVDALMATRVRSRSELVEVEGGAGTVRIYTETLRRMQEALKEAGYLDGAADGRFGPMTRGALLEYQAAEGLEETGVPDQLTLLRLLRP